MIQVSVTSLGSPTTEQLAQFKAFYAGNGAESDEQLAVVLRSAMVEVQEWEDVSLLDENISVVCAARRDPRAPIRLYRTVKTITSVKDQNGCDIEYTRFGNLLTLGHPARNVEVKYEAGPGENGFQVENLLPKAFRLACAKLDGEDAKTVNAILMEG